MRTLRLWISSLLTIVLSVAQLDTPERSIIRVWPKVDSLEDRIVKNPTIPAHLLAGLVWEESHINHFIPNHLEANQSCTRGAFQINGGNCEEEIVLEEDVREGLRIAGYWWKKTGGNWSETVFAYRHGYPPPTRRNP